MARILIFGSAGFMGRALSAHWRDAGHDVVAASRADGSITDAGAVTRTVAAAAADVVVNLAGISSVTASDATAIYQTNAFGHLNVLEACAAQEERPVVWLASTANVYGHGAGEVFREADLPAPLNHYAISKLMAEHFNDLYADRLQTGAVRPFNCIGRGQKPSLVISKLVDAFVRGDERIVLGNLNVRRDYVDIRDVCGMWDAVLAAGERAPRVINFGTGDATPLLSVIDVLRRLSGHDPEVVSSPEFMRSRDIEYQRANTSLLEGIGFRRRHPLEDTLAWMLSQSEAAQ